jgi:UDP-glucose 4-epimerase
VYLKEDSITKPTTVYGHTKLASEDLIIESVARGQVKTYQILRYANIIGVVPELTTHTPQSFIDKIVVASHSGEVITINGDSYDTIDGSVARDFVDVSDVTDVHVQLAEYEQSGIFNVSSGVATTLKQIIGLAEVAAGTTINLAVNKAVATEPASIVVDSTLIRNSLSWSNKKSLPDTIASLSARLAL